jgi:hypothetical protein
MNGTQIFLFRLCRLPFYIMSLPSMPIRRHILALDKQESKFNPTLFRTGVGPICSTHVGLYKQQDTSSFTLLSHLLCYTLCPMSLASRRRRRSISPPRPRTCCCGASSSHCRLEQHTRGNRMPSAACTSPWIDAARRRPHWPSSIPVDTCRSRDLLAVFHHQIKSSVTASSSRTIT